MVEQCIRGEYPPLVLQNDALRMAFDTIRSFRVPDKERTIVKKRRDEEFSPEEVLRVAEDAREKTREGGSHETYHHQKLIVKNLELSPAEASHAKAMHHNVRNWEPPFQLDYAKYGLLATPSTITGLWRELHHLRYLSPLPSGYGKFG